MTKLSKITGLDKFYYIHKQLSIAFLILSCYFMVMHYTGCNLLFAAGGLNFAFSYIIKAFTLPREVFDWTLAYPELSDISGDKS